MSLDTKTFRKAASILLTTALLTVVPGLVPVQAATTQPITVLLDGKPMTFEQPPVMSADGRVMVPFRAIFEALGATVQWNQNQQLVTATLGQNMITFGVKDSEAQSNLETIEMPSKPLLVNNRTMVSVRFIADSLGADVTWDNTHRAVLISSKPLQLVRAIEQGNVAGVKQYLADGNSPKISVAGTTAVGYALSLREVDAAKALLNAGGTYASLVSSSEPRVSYDHIKFSESPVVLKQIAATIKAKQPATYDDLVSEAVGEDDDSRLNVLARTGFQVPDIIEQTKLKNPVLDLTYTYFRGTMIDDNATQISDLLQNGLDPQANFTAWYTSFVNFKGPLLQVAATMNRYDLIPLALQNGANVNAVDPNGWTALMHAAEHGNTASVKALLQGGADPNVTSAKGLSALDIARLHGDTDTAAMLTAASAKLGTNNSPTLEDATSNENPDYAKTATTDLDKESYQGQTDVVKHLLANADINTQEIALQYAVDGNNTETVSAILQNGSAQGFAFALNALNDACMWENAEVVDALLNTVNMTTLTDDQIQTLTDQEMSVSTTNSVTVLQMFLKHGVPPEYDGIYGPLELSVVNGRIDMLNLFLQYGLSINYERGVLMLALLNGYDDEAISLLKAGADPNDMTKPLADETFTGDDELTPLMIAVQSSDADLVQALIQAGANVNAKTGDGTTALTMALARENQAVIQELQVAGATN